MTPTEILAMCRDARPDVAEAGRLLAARMRLPRKVLVTDLDGTLWEGIATEGGTKPRWDYEMKLRGVVGMGGLLAFATWNTEDAVKRSFAVRRMSEGIGSSMTPLVVVSGEVFRGLDRAPSLLRPEDFIVGECGYDPKPEMLRRIARKLSLSVDSFVFMDDDPMQRAHVAQELSGVIVLTPDDDPVPYFEPVTVTDEDRRRAQMYEEEKERDRAREAAPDPRAFLKSLGMKIRIERCRPGQRARAAQLLERTTQFNMTSDCACSGEVYVASVTDRFGDCGLVGVVTLDPGGSVVRNLVLSCRVLGRGIETAIMRSVQQRIGYWPLLRADRTERNQPAQEFARAWAADNPPSCDHAEIENIP